MRIRIQKEKNGEKCKQQLKKKTFLIIVTFGFSLSIPILKIKKYRTGTNILDQIFYLLSPKGPGPNGPWSEFRIRITF